MSPTPPTSRRVFLEQAGLTVGAAWLASRLLPAARAENAAATQPLPGEKPPEKTPHEVTLTPTGWNLFSRRFVGPPVWTWEPLPGAAGYVVMFAGENDSTAHTVKLQQPRFDMAVEWPKLECGWITLIAWAVNGEGQAISSASPVASTGRQFYKSPGFDGVAQKPQDWQRSLERAMAYILAPARDRVYAFEGDMPRSAWSCCEESITGQRRLTSFPALHYPSFIFTYLLFAREFPGHALAPKAVHQAQQYADWLLTHRQTADARCSLFPFSTIDNGRFQGYMEGANITLFRAARVGEGMVDMFHHTQDEKYLAYAKHLAGVFIDLQQADGSWPFRVDPKDGRVITAYTSAAITPARLFGLLEAVEPNARYAEARQKAARWVLENPVRTHRWEGMYEDVKALDAYRGLQHKDTNETISYLMHYHRDDPAMVAIAEKLNRYIEDQFVIWQNSDRAVTARVPTPMVAEQYAVFVPMEVHTGIWIQSLLALHRATGKQDYLTKAINAANAIICTQQPHGAYSTWGFDRRFERPLLTLDWPGCNAGAIHALIQLSQYLKNLPQSRSTEQPI